jgi:hypothetical protein
MQHAGSRTDHRICRRRRRRRNHHHHGRHGSLRPHSETHRNTAHSHTQTYRRTPGSNAVKHCAAVVRKPEQRSLDCVRVYMCSCGPALHQHKRTRMFQGSMATASIDKHLCQHRTSVSPPPPLPPPVTPRGKNKRQGTRAEKRGGKKRGRAKNKSGRESGYIYTYIYIYTCT